MKLSAGMLMRLRRLLLLQKRLFQNMGQRGKHRQKIGLLAKATHILIFILDGIGMTTTVQGEPRYSIKGMVLVRSASSAEFRYVTHYVFPHSNLLKLMGPYKIA